jgi:uncharacterized protein YgbK (DUF1537 family)
MALGAHWTARGVLAPPATTPRKLPARAEPLLVASGSCSPVTSAQIDWALTNGFAGVALEPDAGNFRDASSAAIKSLQAGCNTIVFTSRGEITPAAGNPQRPANALGDALGRLVRDALERVPSVRRVLLAGGDSSSFAARALGIEAVEMIAPLAPGAPLCRASAPGSPADGIEINFKGGQVGAPDYFGAVARGSI